MIRAMLVLSLVGVLLTAALAWLAPALFPWKMPSPIAPETRVLPVASPALPVVDTGINERPLFWASRKAEVVDEAKVDEKPQQEVAFPSDLTLIGLYRSGLEAGAILKSGTTTKRIRQGGVISGWTLLNASDRRAEFSSPNGKNIHELKLQRAAKPSTQKSKGVASKPVAATQLNEPPQSSSATQ